MLASLGWLLSLFSLSISNFCCVSLCSFFWTTLPHQRNLLFFFHTVLVLSLTAMVNIMVGNGGLGLGAGVGLGELGLHFLIIL